MLSPEELERFVQTYREVAADQLDEPIEVIDVRIDFTGPDGEFEVRLFINGEPASRYDSALVNNAVRTLIDN